MTEEKLTQRQEQMLAGYIEGITWADAPKGVSKDTISQAVAVHTPQWAKDIIRFDNEMDIRGLWAPYLDGKGQSAKQAGRDLAYTRNGHGIGFWYRDLKKLGEILTSMATAMGRDYTISFLIAEEE